MRKLVTWSLVVLAVGACGGGDDGAPERPRPPAAALEVRAVLASGPEPCDPTDHPHDGECLELGPVRLDADDVVSARARSEGRNGPELRIRFEPEAVTELNRLAAAQLRGRIAFVADGRVLSAPTVQDASFKDEVVVTGVSHEEITSLVSALAGGS